MNITAEISLYPLKSNYETSILEFIKVLKSNQDIEVYTHAMSTYVKGENLTVFSVISKAVETVGVNPTFSLVIKLINKNLPVEDGFLNF